MTSTWELSPIHSFIHSFIQASSMCQGWGHGGDKMEDPEPHVLGRAAGKEMRLGGVTVPGGEWPGKASLWR